MGKGYSPGGLAKVHNGRRVRRSTETDSCPNGWKVWSPRNKNDWTLVYNAMGKTINNYPKKPHLIVDVTRPANGCGGCTKYAMKSTTSQQGSWRTKDGSAWWLRDARYNEPNGDYHANCYLHIYDVNPNNVRFNDGSCAYYSTEYLCQKVGKKTTNTKTKTVVAYQTPDTRSGCPRSQGANQALITRRVTVKEDSYVVATGHMIRLYQGRADLHLRLNNQIKDYSLTYTPSRQWKDTQVYWVGSIKKGTHTFTVTGSRSNAFGCGPTWGDLDLLVIPKLSGVAVYQFGIPSGCPSTNLVFKKTITLPKNSVVYATGHIITKQKGGRADLYLRINNGVRDVALSEDSTNQWVDLTVNHATNLNKGKYTFSITSNKNAKFGCGAGWGDLDIVVVPRFKGVAAYNQPDTKSGCPARRGANTDLILKTIKIDQTSIIKVTGHIIRTFSGRADAYLKYQRKTTLDTSLTYTNTKRWEDVKLHYTNVFKKGTHTFSIRSNRANAFGCGTAWGDIDILVLPQKLVGTMGGGGKKTTKKPANPCAKNNGGCTKARKCMNQKGKAVCGNCPKGWVNLGAKNCKKGTAPKFSYAGNGKTICGKNKPVANEAACKSAAKTLKKAYGGTGSYAAWPKSCFLYNNKLYFNKHKTGKANKQGNPLCAGAGGGKKTTKKQQKAKTVVAYQTPDTRSGCPRSQGANSALITRRVTVKEDSYVVATGHMIRLYQGRADLHLRLNNQIKDYSLTYTPTRQWKDTQVYWVGSIKKGTH